MPPNLAPPPGSHHRRSMRVSLHRGAEVRYGALPAEKQTAFVRDFSFNGIFLFCDFAPELNTPIEVVFTMPDSVSHKRFRAWGNVVRVEQLGARAIGVAAHFQRCDLEGESKRAK